MTETNVKLNTWATDGEAKSADAAYLVYARAHFSTYDDNKDNTTRLEGFVNFFRGGPPILAAYMEQFNVEFPDPSQHDIPLRIENNRMYRRDIPGSHFLVRITVPPNGEDTWVFNVVVNLVFSDASVYGASAGRVELDEARNEIFLPLGVAA
jgi:hypothetical protein